MRRPMSRLAVAVTLVATVATASAAAASVSASASPPRPELGRHQAASPTDDTTYRTADWWF